MKIGWINLCMQALILLTGLRVSAQDLDSLLNESAGNITEYTSATFKSTHIVSGQSIEQMKSGHLDFRISHRFGELNTGAYNLWGLDQANIHFALDYGIFDWLMVGVGRGTYEKTYDGSLKLNVLRQSSGAVNMPVSVSLFSSAALNTLKWEGSGSIKFGHRLSYVTQVLVARKFGERFSFEVNPSYVHRNLVETEMDPNDVWSVGIGARYKLSRRISVNGEYYYVFPPQRDYRSMETYNPLSVGFDIETGGHVFQLHLTNSLAMIEKGFITETTGKWLDGGIHIGFNISRVFSLGGKSR
jgi:opacity protein-like surface antigen